MYEKNKALKLAICEEGLPLYLPIYPQPAAHASVRRFPFRLAEIGFNFSERKQPNILVGNGEALFSYLDSTERPYLVS